MLSTDEKAKVQLLWGVNGQRDIVLKSELEQLQKEYPGRLDVTYIVSNTDAPATTGALPADGSVERYRTGYVDSAIVTEAMKRCEGGKSFGDGKTQVWLCGPPKMEEALAGKKGKGGVLAELGLGKVHKF